MRCYAGGTIEMSKEITDCSEDYRNGVVYVPDVHHQFSCGSIESDEYTIDYGEQFVDDLEEELEWLTELAREYDINLKGNIECECDGMKGAYVFEGKEYKEVWGNDYALMYMDDDELIAELTRRGYEVKGKE